MDIIVATRGNSSQISRLVATTTRPECMANCSGWWHFTIHHDDCIIVIGVIGVIIIRDLASTTLGGCHDDSHFESLSK
jgi:hypothetical protein